MRSSRSPAAPTQDPATTPAEQPDPTVSPTAVSPDPTQAAPPATTQAEFDQQEIKTPLAQAKAEIEAQGRSTRAQPTVPVAAPTRSTPPAAPPNRAVAEGGVVYLANGSRVPFGQGAMSENGDLVVPGKAGKPGRTIPASAITRIESTDGRSVWRRPQSESTLPAISSGDESAPAASSGGALRDRREAARARLAAAQVELRRLNAGLGSKEKSGDAAPPAPSTEQATVPENRNSEPPVKPATPERTVSSVSLGDGQYSAPSGRQLAVADFGPNSRYQVSVYNGGSTIAIGDKSDPDLRDTPQWIKPLPGVVDVVIHGMPGRFVESNGGIIEIPASVIVGLLERNGVARGTPIRLLTCYATEAPTAPGQSAAKQLFDIWGGPIQGPNGYLLAWPDGSTRIDLIDWGPGIHGPMTGTVVGRGQGEFLSVAP